MTLSKAKQDAKEFRRRRKALDLRQDECAKALGLSRGTGRPGHTIDPGRRGYLERRQHCRCRWIERYGEPRRRVTVRCQRVFEHR